MSGKVIIFGIIELLSTITVLDELNNSINEPKQIAHVPLGYILRYSKMHWWNIVYEISSVSRHSSSQFFVKVALIKR